ncbi:alpha/beta hydrolase [Spongiactinospora gelatinilytica]|uniref:Alpha/beta hydrolase n=1 Tax=Spongiactinospora gelatinilytica TaxID=2666298 RepID=A0A2W2G6R1_9ACTN|nr:alpha/beta hydrolase [Spongiactinospora gelatinilytica]PZG38129.1 alpha/beta hydrolase [Spongiactinospora gelatinilytica]
MNPQDAQTVTHVNGADLCLETFGDRDDPAVLLIGSSMLTWPDGLCRRLAEDRFVIRYDMRDTGRSVSYGHRAAPYTLRDLVTDAMGLLDVLRLPAAHVAGFSVGGWIAQLAALDHPAKVASLTLIGTRPTAPGPADADLPEHDAELMQRMMSTPEPDWNDRESVIEHLVESDRLFAGTAPIDEAERRAVAERTFDRTPDVAASLTNIAFIDHGARWRERLAEIKAPTLVLHGTHDRFFPYGNGAALAREIPGARLVPLEGVGHELPRHAWDTLLSELIAHTTG